MDLKNAFRLLPISPGDFELLGIGFNGQYYFDKSLPFGAAISCQTFEKFASFLEFLVKRQMASGRLIHYLDDFLGGNKTTLSCSLVMTTFVECMDELGVPLADEKTEGPTEVITFLGLVLDSSKMEVRIPLEKLSELISKIRCMLAKEKTTLKDVQSIIGSLNFCCRAIPMGRPFCRRLIDSICGLSKPHHHVRINKGMKLDLQMWLSFFGNHNGISVFHDRFWISNHDIELYSDSAGGIGLGFGAYFKGHWCQGKWPKSWQDTDIMINITALELFPILVAISVWGKELRNKKIKFFCDNQAVVFILNALTSKSARVMCLVRSLTIQCLRLNIMIKAEHVPGHENLVCDALSRFQEARFRDLVPEANQDPDPIPEYLWNVFDPQLQF